MRNLVLTDEVDFVVGVALTLFAVSLGFSIQFSYSNLGVYPTICVYRPLHEVCCQASLISMALSVASLLALAAFWCFMKSRRPVGRWRFIGYLILGAFFGLLPWVAYLGTRHYIQFFSGNVAHCLCP
jgi:hypothetical protein